MRYYYTGEEMWRAKRPTPKEGRMSEVKHLEYQVWKQREEIERLDSEINELNWLLRVAIAHIESGSDTEKPEVLKRLKTGPKKKRKSWGVIAVLGGPRP